MMALCSVPPFKPFVSLPSEEGRQCLGNHPGDRCVTWPVWQEVICEQRARIPSGTHCCIPTTQTGPSNKARWPGRWNGWTLKVCCL